MAQASGDAILDSPLHVPDINRLTQVARAQTSKKGAGTDDTEAPTSGLRARQSDQGFGAQIACGIITRDALDPTQIVEAYPSGYVAGIYARTDFRRGVHKAPANETVRGALDVTQPIMKADQAVLNPASVNCLRFFSREGVKLYGARTLAASASENRYVPVKRLMMLISLSIERGTGWVVFEPNDLNLWQRVKRTLNAFLIRVWRDGALFGATPGEAFRGVADLAYLRSVSDRRPGSADGYYCDISPRFRWTVEWDQATLRDILRRTVSRELGVSAETVDELRDVRVAHTGRSGRATELRIKVGRGEIPVYAPDIRTVFMIPDGRPLGSTAVQLYPERDGDRLVRLKLAGAGWGHGVGMCQWGAVGRARAGQDFRQILTAYFPGTQVERWY